MCKFCEVHGVDGGLWYLNPQSYARQMYKARRPGQGLQEFSRNYRGESADPDFIEIANDDPARLAEAVKRHWENRWQGRLTQVVPLQDAEKIVDLSAGFAAMSCECRLWARGIIEDNPKMYSCGALGVGMLKWERYPERYKGGVDFMSPPEAKEWLRKWNMRGMVHILMSYGGSYVGGLCNCDYPDCHAIRKRVELGVGLLKSHYVCKVNYDLCNGCRECIGRCHFNSLKYEVTTRQANIDLTTCFGCGLCQTVCRQDAIELVPRANFPTIADSW